MLAVHAIHASQRRNSYTDGTTGQGSSCKEPRLNTAPSLSLAAWLHGHGHARQRRLPAQTATSRTHK